MKIRTTNKQVIDETPLGVYLWEMPDGKGFIGDDDGNFLMTRVCMRGDMKVVNQLRDVVKADFGITEGRPVFAAGHRPVSKEEEEEQRQRMALGLEPDTQDLGEIWRAMQKHGKLR